jgi:hypothetical protein
MVVVAQLVELWFVVPAVVGSSPIDHPDSILKNRLYTHSRSTEAGGAILG